MGFYEDENKEDNVFYKEVSKKTDVNKPLW